MSPAETKNNKFNFLQVDEKLLILQKPCCLERAASFKGEVASHG